MNSKIRIEYIERKALKKALRKKLQTATAEVFFQADRSGLQRLGWKIVSHTPRTYATPESYVMEIDVSHLQKRAA